MEFGLCCKFHKEPIRFRTTTATHLLKFVRPEQLTRLSELCLHNAKALMRSLQFCRAHNIASFRLNSQILPLKTHPDAGYAISDLPKAKTILAAYQDAGKFAGENAIRTVFHPDQFVLLSSPKPGVLEHSLEELSYQAEVAKWTGVDVISIHGGGGYGDKAATLSVLRNQLLKLPRAIRSRLALENDDRIYTPTDLLPLCQATGIPLVYDVHHHRCNPDNLTIEQATHAALATWSRKPLFHISSPRDGWEATNPRPHHDFITLSDIPDCWRELDITVEVEAKAKETAIFQLQKDLIADSGHFSSVDDAASL